MIYCHSKGASIACGRANENVPVLMHLPRCAFHSPFARLVSFTVIIQWCHVTSLPQWTDCSVHDIGLKNPHTYTQTHTGPILLPRMLMQEVIHSSVEQENFTTWKFRARNCPIGNLCAGNLCKFCDGGRFIAFQRWFRIEDLWFCKFFLKAKDLHFIRVIFGCRKFSQIFPAHEYFLFYSMLNLPFN